MEIKEFKAKLIMLGFCEKEQKMNFNTKNKILNSIFTRSNLNMIVLMRIVTTKHIFTKPTFAYQAALTFSVLNLSNTDRLMGQNPEKYELQKTYNEIIDSIK